MALAFEYLYALRAELVRVPRASGRKCIPERAHEKSFGRLNEKSLPRAGVGRQPGDAYPSDVYPPLKDFDYEECPRGFTTAAASLASAGGLQINSPRLFAPELATGHQSGSGLHISYGAVHGVLYLVLIRRRKCIL